MPAIGNTNHASQDNDRERHQPNGARLMVKNSAWLLLGQCVYPPEIAKEALKSLSCFVRMHKQKTIINVGEYDSQAPMIDKALAWDAVKRAQNGCL